MKIIPAIDLLDGKCVRLTKGNRRDCKVYSNSPLEVVKNFKSQGATLIHVVDLNGAFEGKMKNLLVIKEIAKEVEIQLGGGIRTKEQIDELKANNIKRIIASTNLNELKQYGVIAGLDFKDGKLAVKGWTETQEVNLPELLVGIDEVIVTDVATDGMLNGPNVELMKKIQNYNVKVIASGGVSSLEDLQKLKAANVNSVIVGKALYENKFTLKEAINLC